MTRTVTSSTRSRAAVRMAMFVAGFILSGWAPLVPFAKENAGLDEGGLGILLLCLGVGSLIAMPATGGLTTRYGCRLVVIIASLVLAVTLPILMLGQTMTSLAVSLFIFGAAVGTLDVAANIQAVILDRVHETSMMSGFLAMFSAGGIAGAAGISALLALGLSPFAAALSLSGVIAGLLATYGGGLLPHGSGAGSASFVLPRGIVALAGLLCFVLFLAEGAILDWSAVFLTLHRDASNSVAGLGYAGFAVAMTIGRLNGDRIIRVLGGRMVIYLGTACAMLGFFLVVAVPLWTVTVAGFVLVGLGASNIVPVVFSAMSRQTVVSPAAAIAAITTMGYLGVLMGPALIGFIAQATSLHVALALVGLSLLTVVLGGPRIAKI